MKRHNRFDGDQTGSFEDGAVCKYALTDHGYTVEALIKWEWLAMADRPVLNAKTGAYETGVLDKFDHEADGAFTYAIVCYLNGNGADSASYRCVYRTVTDPSLAGNFSTATYDIKFTFAKEEQTEEATVPATEEETGTAAQTGASTEARTEAETETSVNNNGAAPWIVVILIICAVAALAAVLAILLKKRRQI